MKEENTQKPKRKINCDEVALITSILKRMRGVCGLNYPGISRIKEMAIYSALYELMEILHLEFEDEAAKHNATPEEVRKVPEDKMSEKEAEKD